MKKHNKHTTCLKCSLYKLHEAHGLCHSCYNSERIKIKPAPLMQCGGCGLVKNHQARGLCSICYKKTMYTKEQITKNAMSHYYRVGREKAIVRALTRQKYKGQKIMCVVCGNTEKLEFDHIEDEHGKYDVDRFVVLCRPCHVAKAKKPSMLLNELCGVTE